MFLFDLSNKITFSMMVMMMMVMVMRWCGGDDDDDDDECFSLISLLRSPFLR